MDRRHRPFLVRIDVQHDVIGARRDRRDQRTLDHLVRRVFEQEAVLEGAGFVLVAVADDVFHRVRARRGGGPLAVSRKSRAAHAAKAGLLDDRG